MTTLRRDGYIARVEIDEEDDVLFGEVINVPGVITFYGSTVDELKAEFAKSIEAYETLCRKHGLHAGKPLSGRFMVRMAPEQHVRVSAAAALSGKSVNAWAVEALEEKAQVELEGERRR